MEVRAVVVAAAETVSALDASRWVVGKWKYGTRVHIPRNLAELLSYICANIV